nr:ABC transporter related protein [uncultured bacterium]
MRDVRRALTLIVGSALRADPLRAAGVLAIVVVSSLVAVFTAYWLKLLADGALGGDGDRVTTAAIAIAVSGIATTYLNWTAFKLRTHMAERTSLRIDQQLIDLAAGLPGIEHHERADYNDRLAMLQRHREVMTQTINALTNNLAAVVRMAGTVGLLASIHPVLALLPAFGLPALWAGARSSAVEQRALDATAERERTADHLLELTTTPGPGRELRIFGAGAALVDRHARLWREIDAVRVRAGLAATAIVATGWLAFAAGYVGVLVFVANRAVNGDASPGDVLMAVTLAGQVNTQVDRVVTLSNYLMKVARIVEKLVWLIDYESVARPTADVSPAPTPERLERGITLESVSFRYPGTDADVLRDVSVTIPAGATVAIVGENGAGKTTLAKLLCRFYAPTSGRIEVDGRDLGEFDAGDWRRRVAAGFQDFARFEFIARETVGVGDLDRIDDVAAVTGALDRASAADVVPTLPAGLDTQLGRSFSGGVDVSGGQWQKLALGRAMMRAAPLLLVLDEPTASLDAETEHALFERYADATRRVSATNGGITLLTSHRFSTVRMADLILVLDAGRLVEVGDHDTLVRRGGLYAELYELQAKSYR